MPFLVLDLLNERAPDSLVTRPYKCDAESFTWRLIYLYICIGENERGQTGTIEPHRGSRPWAVPIPPRLRPSRKDLIDLPPEPEQNSLETKWPQYVPCTHY